MVPCDIAPRRLYKAEKAMEICLILVLIVLTNLVDGYRLRGVPIVFDSATTAQFLATFGCFSGCNVSITIHNIVLNAASPTSSTGDGATRNVTSANDVPPLRPANTTTGFSLYLCEQPVFQYISQRQNLCAIRPMCESAQVISTDRSPYTVTVIIPKTATYDAFFTWCGATTLSASVDASFVNPGLASELSSEDYPLLWTYLVATALWLIAILAWTWNWIHHRKIHIIYHDLIILIPVTEFAAALAHYLVVLYYSRVGVVPTWMAIVRWLITGVAIFARCVILLLATKAYGLLRTRLAAVEWRTVYSVAGFLAAGEVFYRYVGAGAMICLVVFTVTALFYCFAGWAEVERDRAPSSASTQNLRTATSNESNSGSNQNADSDGTTEATETTNNTGRDAEDRSRRRRGWRPTLAASVTSTARNNPKIVTLDGNWDLKTVYKSKVHMLRRIRSLASLYSAVTVVVLAVDLLGLYPYYYVLICLQQVGYLCAFTALARIFRLRPIGQVVVVPPWVADQVRKQLKGGVTSTSGNSDRVDAMLSREASVGDFTLINSINSSTSRVDEEEWELPEITISSVSAQHWQYTREEAYTGTPSGEYLILYFWLFRLLFYVNT
ncbi:hypothetical protein SeMB42_g06175 [Synchytrium endobioticum]|uniref:Uncharacterized protein n=1 Tax=Synchytrium endobioticum TaxID=286115 RepID=A0A507CMJ1_9FUNG|nr:hypothetical protein SeMB42_g06175 [Synchytrium endobioticum]